MQLMFDRICIDLPQGRECYEPEQFIRQPLHLRIQYIMEKRVSFWRGEAEVDIRPALNNYRQWSALKGALASTRL